MISALLIEQQGCWLGASRQRRVCVPFSRGQWPQCAGTLDSDSFPTCGASLISSPHRLVVRASRCGRDNPGSNPGADKQFLRELDATRLGQCPWGCLQGQLSHDRLAEMLEPLEFPVNDQHAPD